MTQLAEPTGPYVETWKGIAAHVDRSERWCRYMARRPDPLPVYKLGGIVRLYLNEYLQWIARRREPWPQPQHQEGSNEP